MELNVAKAIALVVLIVITLALGSVPVWLVQRGTLSTTGSARRKRVLDFLNCFAGGVFLGTCLLHLLAEGREQFEDYLKKVGYVSDFPFYETITAVGLFLVALVERVGFSLMTFSKDPPPAKVSTGQTSETTTQRPTSTTPLLGSGLAEGTRGSYGTRGEIGFRGEGGSFRAGDGPGACNGDLTQGSEDDSSVPKTDTEYDSGVPRVDSDYGVTKQAANSGKEVTMRHAKGSSQEASVRFSKELTTSIEFKPAHKSPGGAGEVSCDHQHSMARPTQNDVKSQNRHHHHDHHNQHDQEHHHVLMRSSSQQDHHHHHQSLMASTSCEAGGISQVSVVRAFLLLIALSFHTVFDGLAVGLQETVDNIWSVFAAIAIHKALVAFCLGLELTAASPNNPRRPYVLIGLFSLISPIGIAIGIGVTSGNVNELAETLTSSILQGIATGTFLYVTFFEILGQQFAHNHPEGEGQCWEILKVIITAVGFGAMAGVKLLDAD